MDGFKEIRHLGRGAFGEVVLARREEDGVLCAVKQIRCVEMSDKEVATHRAEVRALQALNHPCVLRYYDSMQDEQSMRIVTEYADAGDLQTLLKRQQDSGKTFEALVVFALFGQLLMAVAHVHENHIMHRDLKPANVFLTSRGLVKLGDFGVAKVLAGTTVCEQMTCVGSPTYMAPEIVGGEPYGPQCDIWSLGVMLYELCTLKKPFEGKSLGELVMRISSGVYTAMEDHMESGSGLVVMAKQLLDRMLVVDFRARASGREVLRSPIIEMFVTSISSCARCLQAVFRGDAGSADSIVADLEAAAQQAAQTAHATPTSKAAKGGKRNSLQLPTTDGRLHGGGQTTGSSVFDLSQTSVLGDMEISFSLTATGASSAATMLDGHTDNKNTQKIAVHENTQKVATVQAAALASPASEGNGRGGSRHGGGGAMHSSMDAALMRDVLGDAMSGRASPGPAGVDASSSDEDDDPKTLDTIARFGGIDIRGAASGGGSKKVTGAQHTASSNGLAGSLPRKATEELTLLPASTNEDLTLLRPIGSGSSNSSGRGSRRRAAGCTEDSRRGGGGGGAGGMSKMLTPENKGIRRKATPENTRPAQDAAADTHVSLFADPEVDAHHLRESSRKSTSDGNLKRVVQRTRTPQEEEASPGSPSVFAGAGRTRQARLAAAVIASGGSAGGGGVHANPAAEAIRQGLGLPERSGGGAESMDKSATVPVNFGVPLDVAAKRQAHHHARLSMTTPPAGRPTTPESERARKAARDLEWSSRRGAMTIPFFDEGPRTAPPRGFVEAHEAHSLRQQERTRRRSDCQSSPSPQPPGRRTSSTPGSPFDPQGDTSAIASKTLRGSNSAPTLHAPPAVSRTATARRAMG